MTDTKGVAPLPKPLGAYEIESDIPLPTHQRSIYPFQQMQVGDSFLVLADDARRAQTAAYNWAKVNGKKFTTRRISDEGNVRIWRSA